MKSNYSVLTEAHIGPDFWQQYERLWQHSLGRSPFQSPHVLQYFASEAGSRLLVFAAHEGDALIGAAFFKQSGGSLAFLSDMKTDANFFVLHRELPEDAIRRFFDAFLETGRKKNWALMLNHQPGWAPYMPVLEAAVRQSPLYSMTLDYSVCPVYEAETPEALFAEIGSSRNTRYKLNKFTKQENGSFEVLTDDADMDRWVEEFCDAHVLRWAPTPTPSSYRDPARRLFLKNCLLAWHADGVLVRFALKTGDKRVGFVAGLLDGNSLIYHAPTFHPDVSHCSPGRVLIYYIAQWMSENNLRILDFGDGNESYKYHVAGKEHVLRRIFISGKNNLAFIAKTKFIKAVRENPKAYDLYQNKLKPTFRNLVRRGVAFLGCLLPWQVLEALLLDESYFYNFLIV